MNKQPFWSSTEETSATVGISRTGLMELKASKELVPGKHWVYLSGKKTGVLGWDLDEIREWQREKTLLIAEAPAKTLGDID